MSKEKKETIEILGFEVLKPDTEEERLEIEALLEAALRDAGGYEARARALWDAGTRAMEKLGESGFRVLKAPPGWKPSRQRVPTEGYYRRQIAQVRSGEIELPAGADRQAVANAMEAELDRDVAVLALARTFLKAATAINTEIEARVAEQLPRALEVYHRAKEAVAADPDHPAAFSVKQLDRTLRLAQGRAKHGGKSRGKAKRPKK